MYVGYEGKPGDRGGLATSRDLVHWHQDSANPVFTTSGSNRFDSLHIRPGSLFRYMSYFYLVCEGAGTRPEFSPTEAGVSAGDQLESDTIGLARSQDLHTWERYPCNPAIPQTDGTSFDALRTGWPHAILRPDDVYVLYACSDAWGFGRKQGRVRTGLIRFDYRELENWGGCRGRTE